MHAWKVLLPAVLVAGGAGLWAAQSMRSDAPEPVATGPQARPALSTTRLRAPTMTVRLSDGLLSIDAIDTDVAAVAAELARQGAFRFASSMSAPDPISLRFERLPLEQGLLLLLSGQRYRIEWSDDAPLPAVGRAATRRPLALWLGPAETVAMAVEPTPTAARAAPPDPAPTPDPALLHRALLAGTAFEREQAAADLGQSPAARAPGAAAATIHALARALADRNIDVRLAALESLQAIGGEAAANALGTALHDGEPRVREAAVEALSDVGGPTAWSLLQRATGDSVDYVREAAVDALDRARTPRR